MLKDWAQREIKRTLGRRLTKKMGSKTEGIRLKKKECEREKKGGHYF